MTGGVKPLLMFNEGNLLKLIHLQGYSLELLLLVVVVLLERLGRTKWKPHQPDRGNQIWSLKY